MLIELRNVTKVYGSGPGAFGALDGVSVIVERGEFLSVIGPSGSGKSTLLNLMAGLDVPDGGQILLNGQDLARMSDEALSNLRLREIGFVFQSFNLFPALTVWDNVAWPLEFAGVKRARLRAQVEDVLRRVGLADRHARRPGELSGGEQQRAAIARALVNEPSIILADEPTGNLDSQTGDSILALLSELNRDHRVTVVLVTHRSDAACWSDRTIELRDGRIAREVRAAARARVAG
jgi:putative ABC transport system ATP-binding protein